MATFRFWKKKSRAGKRFTPLCELKALYKTPLSITLYKSIFPTLIPSILSPKTGVRSCWGLFKGTVQFLSNVATFSRRLSTLLGNSKASLLRSAGDAHPGLLYCTPALISRQSIRTPCQAMHEKLCGMVWYEHGSIKMRAWVGDHLGNLQKWNSRSGRGEVPGKFPQPRFSPVFRLFLVRVGARVGVRVRSWIGSTPVP